MISLLTWSEMKTDLSFVFILPKESFSGFCFSLMCVTVSWLDCWNMKLLWGTCRFKTQLVLNHDLLKSIRVLNFICVNVWLSSTELKFCAADSWRQELRPGTLRTCALAGGAPVGPGRRFLFITLNQRISVASLTRSVLTGGSSEDFKLLPHKNATFGEFGATFPQVLLQHQQSAVETRGSAGGEPLSFLLSSPGQKSRETRWSTNTAGYNRKQETRSRWWRRQSRKTSF